MNLKYMLTTKSIYVIMNIVKRGNQKEYNSYDIGRKISRKCKTKL